MDIRGGGGGRAEGVLCAEKLSEVGGDTIFLFWITILWMVHDIPTIPQFCLCAS